MHGYFITGTDTDVGKTITSAILTYVLKACYWKPIQSGVEEQRADVELVRELTALSEEHFFPSTYHLKAALSPDQAAAKEGVSIQLEDCELPVTNKPLIVEGAGGIYVPLNANHSMLDLIKKFSLPVIIVARGTLGTINHTLLTIEGLRRHHIPIHGVVFNQELNPANQKAIEQWGKVRTLFHIPFFATMSASIIQKWIYEYTIAT